MTLVDNFEWFPAKVTAAYTDKRTVDVRDLTSTAKKFNVRVVGSPSDYSFPAVGTAGLVVGNETNYYYLGKIEYGYARKLSGEVNPETGEKWPVRQVKEGEAYLTNYTRGSGLLLSSSGGFTLVTQIGDGIKYLWTSGGVLLQQLLLQAKTITNKANNVFTAFGRVIRNVPALGPSVIMDSSGTSPAQEFLASVRRIIGTTAVDIVKVHFGDILQEPVIATTPGVPEVSTTTGSPLKFKIVVNDASGTAALSEITIDNTGAIVVSGTPLAVIKALITNIGGDTPTEPAVQGNKLITWINTHIHSTSFGPSGVPVTPATIADFCSSKVFID
jgi:hypothetical protein